MTAGADEIFVVILQVLAAALQGIAKYSACRMLFNHVFHGFYSCYRVSKNKPFSAADGENYFKSPYQDVILIRTDFFNN